MALILNVFVNNIIPTFLVVGAGVLLDRALHIDKRALSRTAIYLLTPCLVFGSLADTTVQAQDLGRIVLYVLVFTLAMIILAMVVARLLRWQQRSTDALILSVAFLNCGNLGLSVVLFTYGENGLALATIYFVASNFLVNTLGAFFAARGNGGAIKALRKLVRLPGLWAFVLAFAIKALGVTIPELLLKPVNLIGRASPPIMLLMLGIQLSQTPLGKRYGQIGVGVALRLVGGAALAFLLAPIFGMQGLVRSVVITESSMPTAVSSSMMAIEFDADAEYVSSVIFVSTLISSLSLAVVIAFA